MANRTKTWWLLAILAMSSSVLAQRAYIDIEHRLSEEQLREVGLSSEQLELLNRYLQEAQLAAAPIDTGHDERPAGEPRQDPSRFIGLVTERIVGKVKGSVGGWEPGTIFELENGQRWKVLKGSLSLRNPLVNPQIVLVPGLAGRWFLQVDEDMPKARVYRID